MTDEQILKNHTANRLANDRNFLAWHLALYCEIEGLSPDGLCAHLQFSPADLSHLGLCIAPNPNAPDFINRIKNIADYTGVDAAHLAQIVRLVIIHNQQSTSNTPKIVSTMPSNVGGMLMAAREKNVTNTDSNPESPA